MKYDIHFRSRRFRLLRSWIDRSGVAIAGAPSRRVELRAAFFIRATSVGLSPSEVFHILSRAPFGWPCPSFHWESRLAWFAITGPKATIARLANTNCSGCPPRFAFTPAGFRAHRCASKTACVSASNRRCLAKAKRTWAESRKTPRLAASVHKLSLAHVDHALARCKPALMRLRAASAVRPIEAVAVTSLARSRGDTLRPRYFLFAFRLDPMPEGMGLRGAQSRRTCACRECACFHTRRLCMLAHAVPSHAHACGALRNEVPRAHCGT